MDLNRYVVHLTVRAMWLHIVPPSENINCRRRNYVQNPLMFTSWGPSFDSFPVFYNFVKIHGARGCQGGPGAAQGARGAQGVRGHSSVCPFVPLVFVAGCAWGRRWFCGLHWFGSNPVSTNSRSTAIGRPLLVCKWHQCQPLSQQTATELLAINKQFGASAQCRTLLEKDP